MTGRKRPRKYRLFIVFGVVSLLLPALSLMLVGSYYLWQSGYLLPWAIAAFIVAGLVYLWQLWLLRPATPEHPSYASLKSSADAAKQGEVAEGESGIEPDWTPREIEAWKAVKAMAAQIDPQTLKSRQDIFQLGRRTVEIVARHLHPDEADPLLKFTLPEALTLIAQVAGRMRPAVETYLPLSDQITVGQMLKFYGWRSWANYAARLYDVWRILRMVNPAVAITHEMREQASKRLLKWGRDEVTRRLATLFVEEVGRAAIDLYGGRLAIDAAEMANYVSPRSQQAMKAAAAAAATTAPAGQIAEPLHLLLSGPPELRQPLAQLLGAQPRQALFETAEISDILVENSPVFGEACILINAPPPIAALKSRKVSGLKTRFSELVTQALEADFILFICNSASHPPANLAAAIGDINRAFKRQAQRVPPVIAVVVVSGPETADFQAQSRQQAQQEWRQRWSKELGLPQEQILLAPALCLAPRQGLDRHDKCARLITQWQALAPAIHASRWSRIRTAGRAGKFNIGRLVRQTASAWRALIQRQKSSS